MSKNEEFIVSLVVAVADNGVIGREGGLPWRLKSDLRRFRKLTLGHPIIMGGRTYRSIGRPLDGRDSIVLTRNAGQNLEGVERTLPSGDRVLAAHSWDEAETLAKECARKRNVREIFVIGGASLYALALPQSCRLYLSRVHGLPAGDVLWEATLDDEWREMSRTFVPSGPEDDYPVTHLILERKSNNNLQ